MSGTVDHPELPKPALSRRQLAAAGLGLATAATVATAPAAAGSRRGGPGVRLEDRAGITDLFTHYLWCYDCTDEEEFLGLFAEDAIVVGRGTSYRGKEAIRGWFRYLIGLREREGDDIWMHEAGQFRFVPNGRNCIVYAYATHFNANTPRATRGVRSLGYFVCECIRAGNEWKFLRFSISTWDRNTLPWKKPLPWAAGEPG